ncbi:MAG TPA: hypothetical protein VGK67_15320 [Myxococcales bacterium]|jgi:hypothetical protein
MKMILKAALGVETFNNAVRDGSAGPKLGRIMEDLKPEKTYFYEESGKRTALLILDVADPSRIPMVAEPFFLFFNANVEIHPAMTPDDLAKAGLEQLGKRYTK